jgi:Ca-activated chloride channel family protein
MEEYKPRDYTIERWITAILALLFLLPWVAQAQNAEPLPTTTLGEVDRGALLLETGDAGLYAVAPLVSSDVEIRVTGPVVRTTVRQTFRNPSTTCVEGLYVFPLPEMSAVDSLTMTIGSRVVVGEIHEKVEAARQYEQAKSEGRKAALVVQHRPNVFTTSVASIFPDEEATIEIEFQETARFENGQYRLRFPMVVAPRYTPPQIASLVPDSLLNAQPATDVSLSVDLQPGFPVRDVRSSHHRLSQQTLGNNHYQLALDQREIPADRDFELTWEPDLGTKPEASIVAETIGDETYALVMITPPGRTPVRLARETIFIIDSSGSMEGASMQQAREALLLALDDLRSSDTFNIIDFDSEARLLFTTSRPADPEVVEEAKRFVRGLTADGGTEMMKALRLALPGNPVTPGTVRQVIFMTDGQVGNEQQLFTFVRDSLGESRLFTVGIGSAPNSHFMRNAARFGRGTFTYIGDLAQVSARMGELFEKLDSPVMTAIDIRVDDPTAEAWPARVPDLYAGEPLVVTLRVVDRSAPIVVTGRVGEETWKTALRIPEPIEGSGVGKLWARHKIETAMDRFSEGADPVAVRSEVVRVALQHNLVSQYTSLVAVDRSPQGFADATCGAAMTPISNGGGEAVGVLPQTATPASVYLLLGFALILGSIVLGVKS